MKKILFLLLFPCLAWAQYPSNGNQKITLGEQTTADGLVFRGYATTDTVAATSKITRANKQDTSAFLLLDTVTNLLWHYKIGSNGWSQAGGSTFDTTTLNLTTRFATKLNISDTASMLTPYIERGDTASMLTPYWRAGRFSGTLPVANGGTNASTFTEGSVVFAGASGTYTQDNSNLFFDNTNNRLGVGKSNPVATLDITGPSSSRAMAINGAGNGPYFTFSTGDTTFADIGSLGSTYLNFPNRFDFVINTRSPFNTPRSIQLQTAFTTRLTVAGDGNVGIGTTTPAVQFHTTSNVRFAGLVNYDPVETDADGDIIDGGASDFNLKNSIEPINYGLNCINQLKPVSYLWNDVNRKLDSTIPDIGFIAQDVMDVIPEAVRSNGDGDLQLNYKAITATLVKAIQEQQALIKALEQRIINLENK